MIVNRCGETNFRPQSEKELWPAQFPD